MVVLFSAERAACSPILQRAESSGRNSAQCSRLFPLGETLNGCKYLCVAPWAERRAEMAVLPYHKWIAHAFVSDFFLLLFCRYLMYILRTQQRAVVSNVCRCCTQFMTAV